jgi:Zn-dependent oligopeptidase
MVPAYEVNFLARNYEEAKLDLDNNLIKQYLPVSHVVPAVLDMYQELLSLRFVQEKEAETWHPEVEKYRVEDVQSGNVLGYMFLDLFPRDAKYGQPGAFFNTS